MLFEGGKFEGKHKIIQLEMASEIHLPVKY